MVVGQDLVHAQRPQREHRPAIGQAVILVRTGLVQGESRVEIGARLGKHVHVGVAAHGVDEGRDLGPPKRAKIGETAAWKESRGKISAIQ